MNSKLISEVLVTEKNMPKVVRVLLKFNIPIRKYPDFGVWCYLLDAGKDIVIFDSGPKYQSGTPILMLRKFTKKSHNSERIFHTLNKYFPDKTVREILLSHYHYDHSELAPELQQKIYEMYGNTPPIRLYSLDMSDNKRLMKIYKDSINKVYRKAGYESWVFGQPIKDNESIKGTDFFIKHIPGHTCGTVGVISHKYKTIICGWWINPIDNPIVKIAVSAINENKKLLEQSIKKVQYESYNYYYYHPEIKRRKFKLKLRKKKKKG